MNISCRCSNLEKMNLTEFQIDNSDALENQNKFWNYIQSYLKVDKDNSKWKGNKGRKKK